MDEFEKGNQFNDSSFETYNRDLCVCPECMSDLVYPTDWNDVSRTKWEISLRCPNCERTEVGIFPNEVVIQFDDKLDEHAEAVVQDARELTHFVMSAEVDCFVKALNADAILPEDF